MVLFWVALLSAQKSSVILLGDIHYDRIEDHHMEWLKDKPGDIRQVEEYTRITSEHWSDFMEVIKNRVDSDDYPVKAIIQAGDLSEGLAGSEEKARQMASHVMDAVDATDMPVPWIIAKGNHDITGPGAKEAFQEFYVPLFRKQTGDQEIENASYSYTVDDVQITCIDPWDRQTDMVAFLEQELTASDAAHKFVVVHEPVIPVTERCWYVYKNDREKRNELLSVIARNNAVVLCGHLHRYSVVRRETDDGPVVQVMAVSVVRDRAYQVPDTLITSYGASLLEYDPQWQPETLPQRKAILEEEARYVTYYTQTDLPGYAKINIDTDTESMVLQYYPAFGEKPYDTVDLSALTSEEIIK
jgi:3',5'-cyclic AMP phosphodiesterase CpdA